MDVKKKIIDVFTGEHRKFAWFVSVVTVCFICSWLFGSGNTIVHWAKAKREIRRQEKLIIEYRTEIEKMDASIIERTTDVDSLEKFAREQFNFAAPGDDVYIIE